MDEPGVSIASGPPQALSLVYQTSQAPSREEHDPGGRFASYENGVF